MKGRKGTIVALVAVAGVLVLAVVIGVYWQNIAAWIQFVRTFESTGRNEQGYAEYRHRQTGIIFVRVPGGAFLMGSSKDEQGSQPNERPQHEVRLDAFLVAKYEVSQREWEKVMGSNPSRFKGDDLPVEEISWQDCQEYCNKTGLSLPTEAQWEYACRAASRGPFAFGDTLITARARFDKSRERKTVPVRSFEPNGFGLHNVHGNVWEWCEDVFHRDFYSIPQSAGTNPVSKSGSQRQVIRGGSWFHSALVCRSANRNECSPGVRSSHLGFRPAYYPLP